MKMQFKNKLKICCENEFLKSKSKNLHEIAIQKQVEEIL